MAAIETLTEDVLGEADIPAALAMTAEAGWNQTVADWTLMIREGHAVCLRDTNHRPVASALALPVGERLGWISMVLVTGPWRRKGLATRLVETCITWLEAAGRCPVLDATPDGAKVYERIGFERIGGITRWQHKAPQAMRPDGIVPATADDSSTISALDETVFGAARPRILIDLAERGPSFMTQSRDGFVLGRAGRHAQQVGPLTAPDGAAALELLDAALSTAIGPVFLDAFNEQKQFAEALGARGFTIQRPFTRMARGRPSPFGDSDRAYAAAGPELG